MLKLKLAALEHPTPDNINYNDRKVFASTVLWLEDQKIRIYKIEDRENLRNTNDMNKWEVAYNAYKSDLGMPKQLKTPLEELTWMLGYAVRLEFLDAPEKYAQINAQELSQTKSAAPSIKAENFFDNMDFNNKDFIAGVRSLANKLKIPYHPNHLIQLEAIARIVHERLSPSAEKRIAVTGTPFPFEKGDDIVAPKDDPNLDYPVRILRLLQIQSLRELQTRINETVVTVQNLTANPKTDTKLGKVGR